MFDICKKLKVCFSSSTSASSDAILNLFNEQIITEVNIGKKFILETEKISKLDEYCNYLFYAITCDEMGNPKETIDILSGINKTCSHLFIVITDCDNIESNEEEEIVFTEKKIQEEFNAFESEIKKVLNLKFSILKINLYLATILRIMKTESSLSNVSKDQSTYLISKYLPKFVLSSDVDKKRELKGLFKMKKIDIELKECGFDEVFNNVTNLFKIAAQKRIVYNNYVYQFSLIPLNIESYITSIDTIRVLLDEVNEIDYMKEDMLESLLETLYIALSTKINEFIKTTHINICVEPKQINRIDAHKYHDMITKLLNLTNSYNIESCKITIETEIEWVKKMIIDYHNKEMEKIVDLDKIMTFITTFVSDKKSLIALFEKIYTHPRIIPENLENMDKWVKFIEKAIEIKIPNENILKLIEKIIISKINHYCTITNQKSVSMVYPYCLNIFLMENLSSNFFYKKIYMHLLYSIKYTNRNIPEIIQNLTEEQYNELLLIEKKIKCLIVSVEESSQKLNLSEIDIVETFNESESKKTYNSPKNTNSKHFPKLVKNN